MTADRPTETRTPNPKPLATPMLAQLDFDPNTPSSPLLRQIHPTASAPADAENAPRYTLDFRSSDQTLDRYQEVITVAGWKLDNYRKNPVVQNAHSYGSLADTIGKSLITEIRNDAPPSTPYLFQRVQFAVEENPLAKVAYGLYKGGFLKAVSVGFIPLRWENGKADSGYRRKYLEQELVEVSAVSIPANPNALILAVKAGAIEKTALHELAELLAEHRSKGAPHDPSDPPERSDHALSQLTLLLTQIRAILGRV